MKHKKILLILLYFVFFFSFIGHIANDLDTMQEEWEERSFEEVYGSPHKMFEELGTRMDIWETNINYTIPLEI